MDAERRDVLQNCCACRGFCSRMQLCFVLRGTCQALCNQRSTSGTHWPRRLTSASTHSLAEPRMENPYQPRFVHNPGISTS